METRQVSSVAQRDLNESHREYKLLLRAERLAEAHDFHKFWKIARHAARATGVGILEYDKPLHVREVVFFDTSDFKFYEHGFMLRRRTAYKDGVLEPAFELVLKYRHPDRHSAAATDVRPAPPQRHQIKFKEEILLPRDGSVGMRTIHSHNSILDTPQLMFPNHFGQVAKMFPALRSIKIDPQAHIVPVHGIAIAEQFSHPGDLFFGDGVEAKATVAAWRVIPGGDPVVAEFAFQIKFDHTHEPHRRALALSERFYLEVQARASDWIYRANTKTALVYQLGNAVIRHQE